MKQSSRTGVRALMASGILTPLDLLNTLLLRRLFSPTLLNSILAELPYIFFSNVATRALLHLNLSILLL